MRSPGWIGSSFFATLATMDRTIVPSPMRVSPFRFTAWTTAWYARLTCSGSYSLLSAGVRSSSSPDLVGVHAPNVGVKSTTSAALTSIFRDGVLGKAGQRAKAALPSRQNSLELRSTNRPWLSTAQLVTWADAVKPLDARILIHVRGNDTSNEDHMVAAFQLAFQLAL